MFSQWVTNIQFWFIPFSSPQSEGVDIGGQVEHFCKAVGAKLAQLWVCHDTTMVQLPYVIVPDFELNQRTLFCNRRRISISPDTYQHHGLYDFGKDKVCPIYCLSAIDWDPKCQLLWMKWHCKLVHGWMEYTEHVPRWHQFHIWHQQLKQQLCSTLVAAQWWGPHCLNIAVVLAVVHGLLGLAGLERAVKPLNSFSLPLPPTFPHP